jgi:hypothetical protein
VIEAALPKLMCAADAVKFGGYFRLKRGRHLTIQRYAEFYSNRIKDHDKGLSEAVILAGAITTSFFGGKQAFEAVLSVLRPLVTPDSETESELLLEMANATHFFEDDERAQYEIEITNQVLALHPDNDGIISFIKQVEPVLSNRILVAHAKMLGQYLTFETLELLLKNLDLRHSFFQQAWFDILTISIPLIKSGKLTLPQLCTLAGVITDPKGKGELCLPIEVAISEAALPLSVRISKVAEVATSFSTDRGAHRFIIAYVKKCGIKSEAEAVTLLLLTRGSKWDGTKARDAILNSCTINEIMFDANAIHLR